MEKFYENKVLSSAWLMTLLSLIGLAIFGRALLNAVNSIGIGSQGVGWVIGSLIGILLVVVVYFALRTKNWQALFHLVWITGVFAGLMYYLESNPERWLHIPLFGLLAFLSAKLFTLRTAAEISLGYSFLDELIQLHIANYLDELIQLYNFERHGTFEDVQINMFCALVGLFIFWLQDRR